MPLAVDPFRAVALAAVSAAWLGTTMLLVARLAAGRDARARRARASWLGLALQAVGFSVPIVLARSPADPLAVDARVAALLAASSGLLGLASLAVMVWSARALGRHWSLEARVRADHELVTSGPFACVRHPIYAAMGVLLLATCMAAASWWTFALALAPYAAGTALRIRLEEGLLGATFGERHAAYARRVPAVIPRCLRPPRRAAGRRPG